MLRVEHDSAQRRDRRAGFTLLEMLVALSIFSLAALTLLKLQGATLASAADLDQRAIARIVARNVAVETLTDPVAPSLGETRGTATNAGQSWSWERRTARLDDDRLARIDISVSDSKAQLLATLTVVRPVQ